MQEVRNAVDQANREAATRFDFKNTDSAIELGDNELVLRSSTEDRLRALHQVLDEKLVKRQVSLKAFEDAQDRGGPEGHGTPERRHPGRHLLGPRQADQQVHQGPRPQGRVVADPGRPAPRPGKKRDDLQEVIAKCKAEDFGIPLQFTNFRD